MTFEDVLNEAVAMLQRQGRVSYRALKRQLDLDDDYLEDLKDAILFAHPVVDEAGCGLVWTDTGDTAAESATPASPPPQQEAEQDLSEGAIISVEDSRHRVRLLPLGREREA